MKNEDKKKLLLDLSCQMNWSNSRQISKEKSGTQNNVKIIRTGNLSKTLTRSGIGENNKSKNTSQSTNFNNYNLNNVVTPKQLNLISLKYPVPHSKVFFFNYRLFRYSARICIQKIRKNPIKK
jgi:hypothetical protein